MNIMNEEDSTKLKDSNINVDKYNNIDVEHSDYVIDIDQYKNIGIELRGNYDNIIIANGTLHNFDIGIYCWGGKNVLIENMNVFFS